MSSSDRETFSDFVSAAAILPVFDKWVGFIKGAGEPTESKSDRDGFLSYAKESHSLGAGLGVGYTAVMSGDLRMIGVFYEAVLFGNRGSKIYGKKLLTDIRSETQYFLGGLVAGGVLGSIGRVAQGAGLPSVESFIP